MCDRNYGHPWLARSLMEIMSNLRLRNNWAECSDKSERGKLVCRKFSPITIEVREFPVSNAHYRHFAAFPPLCTTFSRELTGRCGEAARGRLLYRDVRLATCGIPYDQALTGQFDTSNKGWFRWLQHPHAL